MPTPTLPVFRIVTRSVKASGVPLTGNITPPLNSNPPSVNRISALLLPATPAKYLLSSPVS